MRTKPEKKKVTCKGRNPTVLHSEFSSLITSFFGCSSNLSSSWVVPGMGNRRPYPFLRNYVYAGLASNWLVPEHLHGFATGQLYDPLSHLLYLDLIYRRGWWRDPGFLQSRIYVVSNRFCYLVKKHTWRPMILRICDKPLCGPSSFAVLTEVDFGHMISGTSESPFL